MLQFFGRVDGLVGCFDWGGGVGLTLCLAACACCRPTELPRNVPSGLKNSSKLIRLKINSKHSQAGSLQQHADPASSLGTAVGSSSSSSSSSRQPSSLLYSAQVGTNVLVLRLFANHVGSVVPHAAVFPC